MKELTTDEIIKLRMSDPNPAQIVKPAPKKGPAIENESNLPVDNE